MLSLLSTIVVLAIILFTSSASRRLRLAWCAICVLGAVLVDLITELVGHYVREFPLLLVSTPLTLLAGVIVPWIAYAIFRERCVEAAANAVGASDAGKVSTDSATK